MIVPPRSVFLMKTTTTTSSTHLMAGFPFPDVNEIISSSSISQYASSLCLSPSQRWLAISFCYMLGSNFIYLARRANLRRMSKRRILRIRTEREPGVSWPLFFAFLLAWQCLVAIYPILEPLAAAFSKAIFFYSYPNASGGGYILEPLSVQGQPSNKRTRSQIRLDWHRFTYNVGGIGRDGYRHPPTISRNAPHLDVPERGLKHWPWRRKFAVPPKLMKRKIDNNERKDYIPEK